MREKSLALKLILATGLMLCISIGCLVGLVSVSLMNTADSVNSESTQQIKAELFQHIEAKVAESSAVLASFIDSAYDTPLTLASQLGDTVELGQPLSREQVVNLDKAALKSNPNLSSIYSQFEANGYDGLDSQYAYSDATHSVAGAGTLEVYFTREANGQLEQHRIGGAEEKHSQKQLDSGIREAEWYLCPMETLTPCLSEPYLFEVKPGVQILLSSLTVPVTAKGGFRGVVGADVNLPTFQQQIDGLSDSLYDGQATVLLVTGKQLVVAASKNAAAQGKGLQQVYPALQNRWNNMKDREVMEVDNAFTLRYPMHIKTPNQNWYLYVSVPTNVAMANVKKLNQKISHDFNTLLSSQIITGLIVILISLGLMWLLIRSVSKPLVMFNQRMENLNSADGDLTHVIKVDTHQELIQLAAAFNEFLVKLRQLISRSKQISVNVSAEGRVSESTAEETVTLVKQQQLEIDSIVTALQEMSAAAHEISQYAANAADTANHASDAVGQSQAILDRSVKDVQTMAADMDAASHSVSKVAERSNAINSILDVIRAIAEQTNLLALNAAIEAARAGESGRGFAVVADEVRSLAEKTRSSTDEISNTINLLNTEVENSISVIAQGVSRAGETVSNTNQAYETLAQVFDQIRTITDQVTQMATSASEQSSVTEEITRNVTQVGDAASQLTQLADRSEHSSQQLYALVKDLDSELNKLKTD